MRDAFIEWLEAGSPGHARVEVNHEPVIWPAEKLLGRMIHCTDVMPGIVCSYVDMPPRSTFSQAPQRVLRNRRRAKL